MNKYTRFFKQPYPLFGKPWMHVGIITVSLIFIMTVFEPFNFKMDSIIQIWVLLGYALTTFIGTSVAFVLFPKLFPGFYDPDKWTVGRNLIHYIFFLFFLSIFIAIMDLIVFPVLGSHPPITFFYYPLFINIFATFSVCLIPIIIITILTKNSELKKNLHEAVHLNKILSERINPAVSNENEIELYGTTRDSVKVHADDIHYMEVSGNYVDIYFMQKNEIKHKLLRVTIKQMEEQLQDFPMLVRCHRGFIVNINQLSAIVGNAQGCKVVLFNVDRKIPVSRRYMKEFKAAIHR